MSQLSSFNEHNIVGTNILLQQAQGPKTPRPIRSERTEWVRTWYALGMLHWCMHDVRS